MPDPAEFDFSDPALFEDPYPVYRTMREADPIHRSEMYGGAWIVFRHRDAVELLAGSSLTNDRSRLPTLAIPASERTRFAELLAILEMWTAFRRGADYRARRGQLNAVFADLRPAAVEAVTAEVVDDVVAGWRDAREIDLVADFARPVTARVLVRLVGGEERDHDRLADRVEDLSYLFATSELDAPALERAQTSTTELLAYFRRRAATASPAGGGAGILAEILTLEKDGFRFSAQDACAQVLLLLFAGLEPSQDLIGNAVLALEDAPDQRQVLLAGDTLWSTAVDEFLRFDPPVQYIGRMAARSFEYRGRHIEAGDPVLPLVGSTNRDPDAFTAPEALDVRSRRKHLALGQGVHRCLGASLLRTQAAVALAALYTRYPHLSIRRPPTWKSFIGFHGLRHLPVDLAGDPTT